MRGHMEMDLICRLEEGFRGACSLDEVSISDWLQSFLNAGCKFHPEACLGLYIP